MAPALGTIARELDVSAGSASWVLTAYLLSASVLTPILGRLGDIVGKRKIMIVVLSLLLAVLVLIALLGTIFRMSESPVRTPGRLDLLGTGILSVGLVAVLLAVSEGSNWGWGSGKTVGLLIAGVAALVVFVMVELRVDQPLIDVRLFGNPGVWTAHLVALAFGFAMFGTFVLIPTLLQLPSQLGYGFGKSVSESGLFLLPTVIAMVIAGVIAGALIRKVGPKIPMVIGAVAVTVAFVVPALGHGQIWQIVVSGILTGIAIGTALAATSNAIVESVPPAQTGEAVSANTVVRTVGSSIGTAVIAALISSDLTPQGAPSDQSFTLGFWACAAVGALALLAALAAPSARKRRQHATTAHIDDVDEVEDVSR